VPPDLRSPVLVSSADGVGTKLKVAMRTGRHDSVGIDLVNHCINDILVEGARALFFLDYIGLGRLEEGTVEAIVEGLAAACRTAGIALIGGETAEMPDFYAPGEYDLAGFIVGVVEEDARPGAARVVAGDTLIALASDGFHTNGYSLLRRLLFDRLGMTTDGEFPGTGASVGDVLLRPHRAYATPLHPLIADGSVKALAHITGGGIPENLARVIPEGASAIVDRSTWNLPAEFAFVLRESGGDRMEMDRTLNMGVGMILVCPEQQADDLLERVAAAGETAWRIGHVAAAEPGQRNDHDRVRMVDG
jgi:phosphoribosylformylglycinamidine cyclo-ligase